MVCIVIPHVPIEAHSMPATGHAARIQHRTKTKTFYPLPSWSLHLVGKPMVRLISKIYSKFVISANKEKRRIKKQEGRMRAGLQSQSGWPRSTSMWHLNKDIKETVGPQNRSLRRRWRGLLRGWVRLQATLWDSQKNQKKNITKIISKCVLFLKHFFMSKVHGNAFFQSGRSHICDLTYRHIWQKCQKSNSEGASGGKTPSLHVPLPSSSWSSCNVVTSECLDAKCLLYP